MSDTDPCACGQQGAHTCLGGPRPVTFSKVERACIQAGVHQRGTRHRECECMVEAEEPA